MGTRGTSRNGTPRGTGAYASAHRQKRRWFAVLGILAALVVFVTVYALMTPAATLTADGAEETTEEVVETDGEEITTDEEVEVEQASVTTEEAAAVETVAAVALPDGAQVPDGYTEQYSFQDETDGVGVTVYAPEGVVPEGATLSVALLSEDDAAYAEAEEALAADDDYGFAALDIHFEVDGQEVEPNGDVYVVIDAESLLPDDADPESVTVQHHAESDGSVTVETVADAADETDGVVAVADDTTVQAAFTVDGFSTFTITYRDGYAITVHLVNENGYELEIDTGAFKDLSFKYDPTDFADKFITNQWVNVEELASTWAYVTEGYTYQAAYRVPMTGTGDNRTGDWNNKTQIYWIQYNTTTRWHYSTNETEPTDNRSWNRTSYDLYLVYEPVTGNTQGGDFKITDNVASDGTFVANYTSEDDGDSTSYYYVWQEWDESTSTWKSITQRKVNGNEYILSGDGNDMLNVVLQVVGDDIDAGGGWYQVLVYESQEAYEGGAGACATSQPYQLTYYDELQNGSFEIPVVDDISSSGRSNYQYPVGTEGLIWRTTGEDQQIEIVNAENVRAAEQYNNPDGAVNGEQYAELNCEAAGALYQDVLTVPGTTLNWQFSHRGRAGDDTMYLLIAPTAAVEGITDQDDLEELVKLIQDKGTVTSDSSYTYTNDSYTYYLVSQTTGNTSWSTVTGNYEVPGGQYLTRFFFVAGNTASGNDTVGNLLDNVYFTTSLLPAVPGTASLQIIKVVKGVDDLPKDYVVTVTVTGGSGEDTVNETVTLTNFNGQADGTFTATESVPNITVPANEEITLTVTEGEVHAITGYVKGATTVQVGDGVTVSDSSATVTLAEQDTGQVTFTNTYKKNTADLSFKKVDSTTKDLLAGAEFVLYKYDEDGTTELYYKVADDGTVSWEKSSESAYHFSSTAGDSSSPTTFTLKNLVVGQTYYLREVKAPDGYNLPDSDIKIVWKADGTPQVYQGGTPITLDSDNVYEIPNTTGAELPATGGSGTNLLTAGGVTLVAAAGCGYVLRRRRERRGELG